MPNIKSSLSIRRGFVIKAFKDAVSLEINRKVYGYPKS